jgi:hypothetical protein
MDPSVALHLTIERSLVLVVIQEKSVGWIAWSNLLQTLVNDYISWFIAIELW